MNRLIPILLTLTILFSFSACGNKADEESTNTTTKAAETTTENPNKTYEATLKNDTEATTYTISTENGIVTKVIMHREYTPDDQAFFAFEKDDATAISKARGIEKTASYDSEKNVISIDLTIDYSKVEPENVKDIIFSEDLDDDELMFQENSFNDFKNFFLGGYEVTEK